jgi:hypothetical protein
MACLLAVLLTGCGPRLDSQNPEERQRAVARLTDQTQLAKVALEDKDSGVRVTAVGKLIDQTLLAKVALEANEKGIRSYAVERLKDQALLTKVALQGEPSDDVPWAAVAKLADQAALAKVALEDRVPGIRGAAVIRLTDQAALAKVAIADSDPGVRHSAVTRLTDPAILMKVALDPNNGYSRTIAIEKLTALGTLPRATFSRDEDPIVRAEAIAALSESDPTLVLLTGNQLLATRDARESIARIKLAIQEPRINNRIPHIVFEARISRIYADYLGIGFAGRKSGESVILWLQHADGALAEGHWETEFPTTTSSHGGFVTADVRGGELLAELLRKPTFTQEDFAELSRSKIPEAREGAVANLTDQTLLAKLALEDPVAEVRETAVRKLTDQTLLSKIAVEDKESYVREAAMARFKELAGKK